MYQDNKITGPVPPELPPLARQLHRAGRWGEALNRARLALRDFRERWRDRTIGDPFTDDMLAGDLAKLVGADIVATRHEFRKTADSAWGAVLAELRDMIEAPPAPAVRVSVGGRRRA